MGLVLEKLLIVQNNSSKKHAEINSETYLFKTPSQHGTIVFCQNNKNGLLLNQSICSSKYGRIKEQFNEWINNNYVHSCNVLKYDLSTASFMCNSSIQTKIIMEYGQSSVLELIERPNQSKISIFQDSQASDVQNGFFTHLQILNLIKFMINTVEEQRQKNKIWVEFHTKSIRYFQEQKRFKYLYIPSLQQTNYSETFFAPEKSTSQHFQMEKSCIFSMGMVLLSIFIDQDCSDCYNYQQDSFCSSIFQSKVEKMSQKLQAKELINILESQQSKIPELFQGQLIELIFLMIQKKQIRINFHQLKQKYYNLVKKASIQYGLSAKRWTKRSNNCQQYSKQAIKSTNPTSNLIETKQFLHNRSKTFNSIESSQFLKPLQINNQKKICSINSALKLKQIISSRYPQKQNINLSN